MQDFEKLGVFYLGKFYDPNTKKVKDDVLLYDSKNFNTHAVCVGMTGSGKTGLGITIVEEAAIDKIPSIVIDPKGDLCNLLLTFPDLSPQEFQPWVDEGEAQRKGLTVSAFAEETAEKWKEGLKKWGEDGKRIQTLRQNVEMAIYTPASRAGIPISILSSFAAPPKEVTQDPDAMRDLVISTTSSILGLIGINADPIKSREHILISTIIDQAWNKGQNLDLATIIQQVQKPPFDKIGALDVETFFPQKERMSLSISLNNLLASPGFQAWMEGVPLDISQLLHTAEGKPRLSVISIAHLSDAERMFFVTLLLNQLLSWMRRQPGTSSLRALLYMDEIFGFFPPTAMPPSKTPMLTLLKQARAFGVGIVLATQNPVDLDYKGLSNCGTWFIGKLQTERDKSRVIEGLSAASNGEIDSKELDKLIALTGNRIFLLRSIYETKPILFETRWTMSYLRGPLTLTQISSLTDKKAEEPSQTEQTEEVAKSQDKPIIAPGIPEFFVRRPAIPKPVRYRPLVVGLAKLHFVDSKSKTDTWKDFCLIAEPGDDGKSVQWDSAENLIEVKNQLEKEPISGVSFEEIPSGLTQAKNYSLFEKSLSEFLYQNQSLPIYKFSELNLTSKEDESESDFRVRVALELREKRDQIVNKLRDKYSQKITTLTEKLRRSQEKVSQHQTQSGIQKAETVISIGATILGAFFGKGVTKSTISQAGTGMRRIGRMGKDSQAVAHAEEDCKALQLQLTDLQSQLDTEIAKVPFSTDPSHITLETVSIKPRKSDISIDKVALIWWPIGK